MPARTAPAATAAAPTAPAVASSVLIADGEGFRTRPVPALTLRLDGIEGDTHAGFSRLAGSREPWYPRGTEIRNDRQVSLVSNMELAEIARLMALPAIDPAWIGANFVVEGVEGFTHLPRGTRLVLPSGACLVVSGENAPCRFAGAAIAAEFAGREGLDLLFPKVARGLRGVVAAVERAGAARVGDALEIRLPR